MHFERLGCAKECVLYLTEIADLLGQDTVSVSGKFCSFHRSPLTASEGCHCVSSLLQGDFRLVHYQTAAQLMLL
jgi:hypothetical protein